MSLSKATVFGGKAEESKEENCSAFNAWQGSITVIGQIKTSTTQLDDSYRVTSRALCPDTDVKPLSDRVLSIFFSHVSVRV